MTEAKGLDAEELMEEELENEFDIGLNPTGDDGSSFRTENDPASPYQRKNVTERKGVVDVRCSLVGVAHGLPHPDSDDFFATLILLKFTFASRKEGRRIKAAHISLQFAAMDQGGDDPEVAKIAPHGSFHLVRTTQQEDEKRSLGLNIGAPPLAGIQASAELGWEKNVSRETSDATKLVGSIDLVGRNYGAADAASWSLMENGMTKAGVPASMCTAILLKRRDEKPFRCAFKIKATVDFLSSVQKLFGSRPKDDPIWFNPAMEPTENLQKYDPDSLEAVNIEELASVAFPTALDGAGEHV
ncbi:uncharacterized protein LTHEOB_11557 [Lasiodiplodia theobromae]|uniref:uncharacterized protein n=1 Tax=Lasiodiplodia theobromae TaxID=45133 RepID=UPI0015C2ED15|nr:uncharacterized protein LTHEOB_11557 [Lasiodiplodia theobromae]KAF4537179.1 hypothetical protein LTHEOB_11557 [Lasiodiplodia theobromae]